MFTPKAFSMSRNFAFVLAALFIFASCGKEEVKDFSAEDQSVKRTTMDLATSADFPDELTMENWEEFVHAPQSVIDELARKEALSIPVKEEVRPDLSVVPEERGAFTFGYIQAFNGSVWGPMGGVGITTNNCGTQSYPFQFWTGGPNYFLSSGCTGALCLNYTTAANNGVSVFDLVLTQRHILGLTCFTTAQQYIAADANRDGQITAADITEIQQVILAIVTSWPNSNNVIFAISDDYNDIEASISGCTVDNLLLQWSSVYPNCLNPAFTDRHAVKTGDVNGSWTF